MLLSTGNSSAGPSRPFTLPAPPLVEGPVLLRPLFSADACVCVCVCACVCVCVCVCEGVCACVCVCV